MTAKQSSVGTEAAERVADVLLAFSRGGRTLGISALSRELQLSKAVVYRILQSLLSRGLVDFDPTSREYGLGPSAIVLGARALRYLDLREVAREDLLRLRDLTRETTTLSLLAVDHRTYVDQYESPQEIRMEVELGRLYPLHAGASSRAILAFLPEPEVERVLRGGLDPLTEETVIVADKLREGLVAVRSDGYATSRGERRSGAGSVAAPVFSADGRVTGSISVCGPLLRFNTDAVSRYVPLVTEAAANISRKLGHIGR